MNIVEKENAVHYMFDNLAEMAEYADSNTDDNYYSKKDSMHGFCDMTFAEAVEKAKRGDVNMTRMFSNRLKELKSLIMSEREGRIHDVTGEFVDIGAYLAGQPECFVRRQAQPDKPCIRVVANMAFSSDVSQYMINNRGAGIVALVDELQDMGYCVNLTVGRNITYYWLSKKNLQIDVAIRNDPIDLSEISFASCVGFTRRLGFAITELYIGEKDPALHGKPSDMDIELEEGEKAIVFVSSSNSNFEYSNYWTLEATKRHILNMVDEIAKGEKSFVYG